MSDRAGDASSREGGAPRVAAGARSAYPAGPDPGGGLVAWVAVFARIALAAGFFSAVADRFGLWGPPGAPGVAWGSFERFVTYTGQLNPYLPAGPVTALAWTVTVLELGLGGLLLVGFHTRRAAAGSGILLLLFALAMTLFDGVKSPLDASVFAASAAAFLLASVRRHVLALDRIRDGEMVHVSTSA